MMAKMFYTLEETKAALGRGEDDIKQLAREGRLREFRDGPRLMFKADQVEQLKSELGAGDAVDIGVSDSGGLISMVDTTGASGTSITLSDADAGQSSGAGMRLSDTGGLGTVGGLRMADTGTGASPGGGLGGGSLAGGSLAGGSVSGGSIGGTGPGMRLKEDTALSMDLGLSGSLGGVPSPGRPGGVGLSGTALSGGAGSSRQGINVFGADDSAADASAQTVISGGIRNQMALEGVGSGSGLLDLTRESDDTSLGAVLDEITPAGRGGAAPVGLEVMEDEADTYSTRAGITAPAQYVEAADPMAPAFGAMALAGFGAMMFGIYALISAVVGTRPPIMQWFDDETRRGNQFMWVTGLGLLLAIVFFVVGMIVGKTARR